MRRRIVLVVLATTSLVVVAFAVPLAALVRTVAHDRAIANADRDVLALAPTLAVTDETEALNGAIQNTGTGTVAAPATRVYRTVEIVDGREVVRYSGKPRENSERLESAERR